MQKNLHVNDVEFHRDMSFAASHACASVSRGEMSFKLRLIVDNDNNIAFAVIDQDNTVYHYAKGWSENIKPAYWIDAMFSVTDYLAQTLKGDTSEFIKRVTA